MNDTPTTREDLLRLIRRYCEPETCAAIEVGWLQEHLGEHRDAASSVRELWAEGLIEPTFAEADPEDGALFRVPEFGLDAPFKPETQFVLSREGYAAVEPLLELRSPLEPPEFLSPPPAPIIEAATAVDAKILEKVARHPELMLQLTPRSFEEFVGELFEREGFKVELTPPSRDGGRDILAVRSSTLGDQLVLVECKRYSPERPVGVGFVRALYGVLEHEKASRAVLATTSHFTKGAVALADELRWRMSLQDYEALKQWLQRLNLPPHAT